MKRHKGQALVESIVGISFVVIPIFMLLPFLSKVASLKHSAEEASHYSAWERTVWKNSEPSLFTQRSDVYLAKRTEEQIAEHIPSRFYGRNDFKLSSEVGGWDWKRDINVYSKYQAKLDTKGQSLIKLEEAQKQRSRYSNQQEFEPLKHDNNGDEAPGRINIAVNRVLGLLRFTGFSLENDQFYRSGISTDLENLHFEEFENLNINLAGNSALLASGWNAAGFEHSRRRNERLVLTRMMNNGVIRTVQRLVGIIPFAKEIKPNSLKLGHVDPYVLPQDKLCRFGTRGCGE